VITTKPKCFWQRTCVASATLYPCFKGMQLIKIGKVRPAGDSREMLSMCTSLLSDNMLDTTFVVSSKVQRGMFEDWY